MVARDQELKVTQERLDQFQRGLIEIRRTARPAAFDAVTGGYCFEIERMQAEVMEYLLRPAVALASPQAVWSLGHREIPK
jgi:hypothetical protein